MKYALGIVIVSAIGYSFIEAPIEAVSEIDNTTLTVNLESDDYRVIKVNGHIFYVSKGSEMAQGDVFSPKEQLKFKTDDSKAAVISKVHGRKILSPKNGKTSKATLLPPMNNISSRSGGLNNLIDLKNHFDGNYLVLERSELKISDESFPMNDKAFFFLSYSYNGETINKKLSHDGDKLILSKEEIFKIDGKAIDVDELEKVELAYLSDKSKTPINTFKLVSPNTETILPEIQIINEEISDDSKRVEEITSYLNEYYGKANKANLSEWIDKHLK